MCQDELESHSEAKFSHLVAENETKVKSIDIMFASTVLENNATFLQTTPINTSLKSVHHYKMHFAFKVQLFVC